MRHIKIGRSKENDVVIGEDSNVSRNHAEIFEDDEGRVFLTDLDSANGTFINGKKLKGSELLKKNDIVKIGKTVLPWKNYLKKDLIIKNEEIKDKITNEVNQTTKIENNLKEPYEESNEKKYKEGFFYKYFTYNGEYISGGTYWWRMLLQSFLILFFGLGLYLIAVTVYKRSKSFRMDNTFALIASIIIPLLIIIARIVPEPGVSLILLIPHLIYIFKNGKKQES